MAGFNKAILMGNCVRDPELRYTPSGTPVTDFSLAVNRITGSGDNRKQETLFIDITAWGRTAETLSRYLSKGSSILVEGRLVLDRWESGGEKRSKIKVVVESFQFLSSRQGGQDSSSRQSGSEHQSRGAGQSYHRSEPPQSGPEDDDDVPF